MMTHILSNLPEEYHTIMEIIEDLQKLDVQINNSEMMTHILSNLPKEFQTIVEILKK